MEKYTPPRSRKELERKYKEILSKYRGKNSSELNEATDNEFSGEEIDILFPTSN